MEENIINKARLREILRKRNLRINHENLNKLSFLLSKKTEKIIEKIERNLLISGRKTIKKEDLELKD